ncbi:hypothetical protein BCR34DRAFT_595055 [Clohesyomyces aquaticus]|uniref:Uncharacterized protein n=1 Tax=Clohesyomyces aquaticus TaxID=1231657 RepID=A0A1Y1Y028_9PLEO|nr:hypothetical protein BCR34DRAFT_595055 [Clohesyomyces aquaticus]
MCHITRTIAADWSHPITENLDKCPQAEPNGLPCEEAPSLTVEEFQYPGKCHMCHFADSEREEQAHLQSAQHYSHQEWQTHASRWEEDDDIRRWRTSNLLRRWRLVGLMHRKGSRSPREEEAVQRLMTESHEEFMGRQKKVMALGAMADDDESIIEVPMKSIADWHRLTHDKPAMPDLSRNEEDMGVDLNPRGKGKGHRDEMGSRASAGPMSPRGNVAFGSSAGSGIQTRRRTNTVPIGGIAFGPSSRSGMRTGSRASAAPMPARGSTASGPSPRSVIHEGRRTDALPISGVASASSSRSGIRPPVESQQNRVSSAPHPGRDVATALPNRASSSRSSATQGPSRGGSDTASSTRQGVEVPDGEQQSMQNRVSTSRSGVAPGSSRSSTATLAASSSRQGGPSPATNLRNWGASSRSSVAPGPSGRLALPMHLPPAQGVPHGRQQSNIGFRTGGHRSSAGPSGNMAPPAVASAASSSRPATTSSANPRSSVTGIRAQQQAEYEGSLAADREKAKKKQDKAVMETERARKEKEARENIEAERLRREEEEQAKQEESESEEEEEDPAQLKAKNLAFLDRFK